MIYIGIGSNLKSEVYNSSKEVCLVAIEKINKYFNIKKISSFYESEPVPKSNQPLFANAVFEIETNKNANEILEILHSTEKSFGRIRQKKNESRILDLDLIDYKGTIINTPKVIIPHPRMHLRKFVLLPLNEIAPNWIHPVLKNKIPILLRNIHNDQKITKL